MVGFSQCQQCELAIQPASRDTSHAHHAMLSSLLLGTADTARTRRRIRHHMNRIADHTRNERRRKATRNWTPAGKDPVDSAPPREKARVGLASSPRAADSIFNNLLLFNHFPLPSSVYRVKKSDGRIRTDFE
jgi:hypothetical protein